MNVKTLLISILAIIVCGVIIVGATAAIFTDNVTTNNHISSGNLKVGLNRISYKEAFVNADGIVSEGTENTERVNLAEDESILFNIENAVPTSCYEATLEVANLGSVAFDYGVRILWTANENKDDNDEILASQIKITVVSDKIENGNVSFMLPECGKSENDISLGSILKDGAAETFTVKAEFLDNDDNNGAMLASINFDIQVFATQKIN